MDEDKIIIKRSTVWKIGFGVFVFLFLVSIFTNGFGLTGNSVANSNTIKSSGGVTEVTTVIQGFKYNPEVINVKKGETVRLTIENKDNVLHGLHLPQFGIVDGTPANSKKTVEFKAVETPTNGRALSTCTQEHGEKLTINVI